MTQEEQNEAEYQRCLMSYPWAERVCIGLPPNLVNFCHQSVQRMHDICDSPIEVMLAAAFDVYGKLVNLTDPWAKEPWVVVRPKGAPIEPRSWYTVTPQVTLGGRYRVDFLVQWSGTHTFFVVVECDGHEFHERTAEQAEKDRSRDRELQGLGFPVLRFTGREIHRSPRECADQVFEFLGNKQRAAAKAKEAA